MSNLNINAPRGYLPLQTMSSSPQSQRDAPGTSISRAKRGLLSGFRIFVYHFKKHVGAGIICSVAYFDPYANHLNIKDRFLNICQRQLECRPPSWVEFWLPTHAFCHPLDWLGCDSVSSKLYAFKPGYYLHYSFRLLPANSVV